MDPNTERMLERARARRQKLDSQLLNTGHEVTRKRSPLQESNQTQLLKVTTEEFTLNHPRERDAVKDVTVSPTKVEYFVQDYRENKDTSHFKENTNQDTNFVTDTHVKENTRVTEDAINQESQKKSVKSSVSAESSGPLRDGVRSRLQRLGVLYSDSANISSPIHRTEGNFSSEPIEEIKLDKPPARVARLAALADTIKQWDDDLGHSQGIASTQEVNSESPNKNESMHAILKTDKTDVKKMACTKSALSSNRGNPSTLQANSVIKADTPKKVVWDKAILETLENDEKRVSPTKTNTNVSTTKTVPGKLASLRDRLDSSPEKGVSASNTGDASSPLASAASLCSSVGKLLNSPDKPTSWKGQGSPQRFNNSPDRPAPWKTGVSPHRFGNSPDKSSPWKAGGSPRKLESNSPDKPVAWKCANSPQRMVGEGSPKSGSVLHKASFFESTSPNKKPCKDPAELSVSERLALFERNKGQALVPKAAFSMSVPAKLLGGGDSSSVTKGEIRVSPEKTQAAEKPVGYGVRGVNFGGASKSSESPKAQKPAQTNEANTVLAQRQLFERGAVNNHDNAIARSAQSERQKEIEMLLNRWDKNKHLASVVDEPRMPSQFQEKHKSTGQEKCGPPPPPPPPPQDSRPPPQVRDMTPKPNATALHSPKKNQQPCAPISSGFNIDNQMNDHSSSKRQGSGKLTSPNRQYPAVTDIKRIKVSPPKPGNLYPCLSDIDAATETESEFPDEEQEYLSSDEMDSSSNLGDTSFGREILQAAGIHKSPLAAQSNRQVSSDSDLSAEESAVLEDVDDFLNEALESDSSSESDADGPTPPKRPRDKSSSPRRTYKGSPTKSSPTSTQSQSFRYSRGVMERPAPHIPTHVIDGDEQMPLMHTVSFYRRQQNLALKGTPVKQVVRQPIPSNHSSDVVVSPDDPERVRNKISTLLDEVSKQQTVISQASQALNLCCSTVEFSGSAEEVEGERLLLSATHKRQAALHEIQRLKVEGSLKPITQAGQPSELLDKGTLTISEIILPLKKEYLYKLAAADMCHYVLCLLRSQEQVLVTQVVAVLPENLHQGSALKWIHPLKLSDLYSDFKVTLEVYTLQCNKEILPHNIKYHIGNKKESSKLRLTPKKLPKQESRLMMPIVQSPAGPSAVRSPNFHLAGYVVFSLRELARSNFTLNKVAYTSPLEGTIQLKMTSELLMDVTERGFLTMFEDISGFGAWHRRWCLLKGHVIAYWRYPDDEKKKEPIGQIDLKTCTTKMVGLVSRDICARPNTFLLETTRTPLPDDEDSLVLIRSRDCTTIRNLLSADTRDDRLQWCEQLNKALSMLRVWGNKTRH